MDTQRLYGLVRCPCSRSRLPIYPPFSCSNILGFGLEFENGGECHSNRHHTYLYKTDFIFECDQSTELKAVSAAVDQFDACLYTITVQTKHACLGGAATSSAAFSAGYLAIIVFFAAVILLMIGYYVVLGIKTKNWGKESMTPPFHLCKYFWIFSFVGCKVSLEFVQKKISKKSDGGDLGDDLVDTDD